ITPILLRGDELAARSVDLLASRITQCRRNSSSVQPIDELARNTGLATGPDRTRRRIERDGIDVHPPLAACVELLGEQICAPTVVVHIFDEGVLNRDAATRAVEVGTSGVKHFIDLPAAVDWDELVTKLIIGRVQR